MDVSLTTRGNLEIDHEGRSVTVSREQLVAALALGRDSQSLSRAWELLTHFERQCDVCGELGCFVVAHVASKRALRGAALRRTVEEILHWQPHMSRTAMARRCGYPQRAAWERELSSTFAGSTVLAQVWKDSEARFARVNAS